MTGRHDDIFHAMLAGAMLRDTMLLRAPAEFLI